MTLLIIPIALFAYGFMWALGVSALIYMPWWLPLLGGGL